MSEELRKIHRDTLKTRTAQLQYASMCRERRRLAGALDDHAELIIYNIAQLTDVMEELRDDIKARGVTVPIKNGKQTFRQQNKSVYELERAMARQAHLSARLGMIGSGTPTAGGEEPVEGLESF